MKLIYKIFAAAASILALSSCVESAIEPMTGKYEKPVVYEMNTLASQSVEKGDKNRTFTVELSGDNASMTLKMVNDKYFLADGSYTPAPADQAKKNTYIVGNGGTTFNNIPVETGSIKVVQGDERLFVAMPSRKDENGIFRDIVHPISPDARRSIEENILEAYERQAALIAAEEEAANAYEAAVEATYSATVETAE